MLQYVTLVLVHRSRIYLDIDLPSTNIDSNPIVNKYIDLDLIYSSSNSS